MDSYCWTIATFAVAQRPVDRSQTSRLANRMHKNYMFPLLCGSPQSWTQKRARKLQNFLAIFSSTGLDPPLLVSEVDLWIREFSNVCIRRCVGRLWSQLPLFYFWFFFVMCVSVVLHSWLGCERDIMRNLSFLIIVIESNIFQLVQIAITPWF